MPKGDHIEMGGHIESAMGGGKYSVKVEEGGAEVIAQLSGRMKKHHIRVIPGDDVTISFSPYDLTHGFITFRGKPRNKQ